jgi:hypothetical protein
MRISPNPQSNNHDTPKYRFCHQLKKARLQGKEVADPYLIAKAKVLNICVVTEEKLKDNAAKIPNVCQNFDVCCMNLEQFMQKERWSF